jgi:hypothetical protein
MPEWLQRDDRPTLPWTVVPGSLQRGDAYTDLVSHRMQVPTGHDETSRCVRAHEMMHAKVSPPTMWIPDDYDHLHHTTVIAAEEFRVNMLIRAAGFPVEQFLADGSEKSTGERLGANRDWNAAVLMLAAVAGTKSARPVMNGLRSSQPEWIPAAREIMKQLQQLWRSSTRHGVANVASTTPWLGATEGWRFTLRAAIILQRSLINEDNPLMLDSDDLRRLTQGRLRKFAPLVEGSLERPRRIEGYLGQRRSPQPTGRHPLYLSRLLTDSERRVFAGRRKSAGGTVLIDQSGSMHLSESDLWKVIAAAPGCTVIGYSHHSRSRHHPNIWILAQHGHVVATIPPGNGGNGVDGPALQFAVDLHRPGDPLIWVCDGYVTDDQDNFTSDLVEQCARLVIQHRIHQVGDVDQAVSALNRAARGRRLPTQAIGPIQNSQVATAHFGSTRSLSSS